MPFGFGKGRGRGGRGRGFHGRWPGVFGSRGPVPVCVCPKCGLIMPRSSGLPCFQTRCPRCGSIMARQFFHEE